MDFKQAEAFGENVSPIWRHTTLKPQKSLQKERKPHRGDTTVAKNVRNEFQTPEGWHIGRIDCYSYFE